MRKFDVPDSFYCASCGKLSKKEEWEHALELERDVRVCPYCGSLVDVTVRNTLTPVDKKARTDATKAKK